MTETNVLNFPKVGEVFLLKLGNRKRIIFLQPKLNNDLEFDVPRSRKEVLEDMTIFDSYSQKVRLLTKKNLISIRYSMFKSNLFSNTHIDHKISISTCFKHGVSIQDAAHISNLQVLTKLDNLKKGKKNLIDFKNNWILSKYNISLKKKKWYAITHKYYRTEYLQVS